jgi:hypothetical protein
MLLQLHQERIGLTPMLWLGRFQQGDGLGQSAPFERIHLTQKSLN